MQFEIFYFFITMESVNNKHNNLIKKNKWTHHNLTTSCVNRVQMTSLFANRMNELLKVKVNNFLEEEPEGW